MLEIGIRLQQLLMLHPYAVRWQEPSFDMDRYGRLINTLWNRISQANRAIPICEPQSTQSRLLGEACYDLHVMWENTIEFSLDGNWVKPAKWIDGVMVRPGFSAIPTQIECIADLIEQSLGPTDRSAIWYRVGRCAAAGRTDATTGKWILESEAVLQAHLDALNISQSDLFVGPTVSVGGHHYPDVFGGWRQLDAGLESLAAKASASSLPSEQQAESNSNESEEADDESKVTEKRSTERDHAGQEAAALPPVGSQEELEEQSHLAALLKLYAPGVADERLRKAKSVLADKALSVNDKLNRIDELLPIPPTTSAEELGRALGCSRQAVAQTAWWKQNRKGEKANEIGRRAEKHRERTKQYEENRPSEEDEW